MLYPFKILISIMKFNKDILNGSGCASSPDIGDPDDELKACGGCMLCKVHLNKSTNFKSAVTNETFSLSKQNHGIKVACTTKNVV